MAGSLHELKRTAARLETIAELTERLAKLEAAISSLTARLAKLEAAQDGEAEVDIEALIG